MSTEGRGMGMAVTTTQTLSEFLLARYAEDEATASVVSDWPPRLDDTWVSPDGPSYVSYCANGEYAERMMPARVLAECEAKRRIVALHKPVTDGGEWFCDMLETGNESTWPCMTARLLALPYADHPDYRPEWRP